MFDKLLVCNELASYWFYISYCWKLSSNNSNGGVCELFESHSRDTFFMRSENEFANNIKQIVMKVQKFAVVIYMLILCIFNLKTNF